MNYSVEYLITLLRSLQNPNGSFSSHNTTTRETLDSIYFTSLILVSLQVLKGDPNQVLELIVGNALGFLLANESATSSWNYYPRTTTSPYPDDTDDTILVMRALEIWKPEAITPTRLAHITQLLISCELAPGGPYKTWITPQNIQAPWNDVDTIVNYSIQSWLTSQEIQLKPLRDFLALSTTTKSYQSLYYEDPRVITYLTNYQLSLDTTLTSLNNTHHPLTNLFDLLNTNKEILPNETVALNCIAAVLDELESYEFFIETISAGKKEYAGCKALEVSLCIELLATNTNKSPAAETVCAPRTTPNSFATEEAYVARVRETIIASFSSCNLIQDFFVKQFDMFITRSRTETLLPYYYVMDLTTPYRNHISHEQLVLIGAAHIIGLISFTKQDAICDRESAPETIPYVTSGIISMNTLFHGALYGESTLEELLNMLHAMNQSLIRETSKTPDMALAREELHLKSIGIMCGILAIVLIVGERYTYNEIARIKDFFKNYLQSRQLLDDLHDWYEDLESGIHTPVTQLTKDHFLKKYPSQAIDCTSNKMLLHELFWNYTFPEFAAHAQQSLVYARSVSNTLVLTEGSRLFTTLLHPLESAIVRASTESNHQKDFIYAYEKATLASGS